MQIIINTTNGTVTINSSEALMLKQDRADQQRAEAMRAIGEVLSEGLNSLEQGCEGAATTTNAAATTATATEALTSGSVAPTIEVTDETVVDALRTLLSEDSRYSTRSAKAIAKKIGCDVEAIQGILNRLTDDEVLNSRVRRNSEVVYSL